MVGSVEEDPERDAELCLRAGCEGAEYDLVPDDLGAVLGVWWRDGRRGGADAAVAASSVGDVQAGSLPGSWAGSESGPEGVGCGVRDRSGAACDGVSDAWFWLVGHSYPQGHADSKA